MITLPAHTSTALAKDTYTICYVVKITTSGSATDTYWGLSSGVFYWSTKPLGFGSYETDILQTGSFSNVTRNIDIRQGGTIGKINNFSFSIVNIPRNSEAFQEFLIDEGIYLENRKIEFYVIPDYATASALTDGIPLFTGIIRDFSYNYESFTFQCQDDSTTRHRELLFDKIDTNTFADYVIPKGNIDKFVPLVFGEMGINGNGGYAKGFLIDKRPYDGANFGQIIICSDLSFACKSIENAFVFEEIYEGDYAGIPTEEAAPDIKEYNALTSETGIIFNNTSTDNYMQIGSLYVKYIANPASNEINETKANDEGKAYDNDTSTYAYIDSFVSASNPESYYLKFRLPLYKSGGETTIKKIYLIAKISVTGALPTGASVGQINVSIYYDDEISSTTVLLLTNPNTSFNNIDGADTEVDINLTPAVGVFDTLNTFFNNGDRGRLLAVKSTLSGTTGATQPQCNVYEFGYRIEYIKNFDDADVYFHIKGLKDDVSGTYTGVSVALVEEPDFIIHFIEGELLDIDSSKINISTTTIRTDWKMAFQLLDPDKSYSLNIIKDICKQSHLCLYNDYQGKDKLVDLAPAGSTAKTITDSNIRAQNGKPVMRPGLTPVDDIYNGFFIRYNYDIARDRYLSTAFVKNTGTLAAAVIEISEDLADEWDAGEEASYKGKCEDSIENYQLYRTLYFDADKIQDPATIAELMKLFIDFYTQRQPLLEWETPSIDLIDIELGDQLRINTDYTGGGSADDRFFVYGIDYIPTKNPSKEPDRLRFRARNIKEPSW